MFAHIQIPHIDLNVLTQWLATFNVQPRQQLIKVGSEYLYIAPSGTEYRAIVQDMAFDESIASGYDVETDAVVWGCWQIFILYEDCYNNCKECTAWVSPEALFTIPFAELAVAS